MDEEEVELLVAELRAMLQGMGFGWVAEQAEAGIHPATTNRAVAHALIDAAETVTVDLAQAELTTMQLLQVDEVVFQQDPDPNGDARDLVAIKESVGFDDKDRIRGRQRRVALDLMSGYAPTFAAIRTQLDGVA